MRRLIKSASCVASLEDESHRLLSAKCHIGALLLEHDDQSLDLASLSFAESPAWLGQLFALGVPESRSQNPIKQVHYAKKISSRLRVYFFFSQGNAPGPPTSLHGMKIL